ncbi:MAG: hypothetical protein NTU49_04695, partial [Gammaproteobacteria bacterium]|nr:hypothetical protein [Gammaproteobacteria bacterium]
MHGKRLLQYALCVLVTICFTCLAVSQPLNSPPVLLAAPHNIVSSTPTSVPAITTQNKSLPIK